MWYTLHKCKLLQSENSGAGGRRIVKLCFNVKEDRGLVQKIKLKQSFLLMGQGFLYSSVIGKQNL